MEYVSERMTMTFKTEYLVINVTFGYTLNVLILKKSCQLIIGMYVS